MGTAGGGVWKTTDAGETWNNVSDGTFGGSIGAVAVAPSDPNVVYVGGGEKTVRGNVSHGDGMWRSTDAGKTWQKIGLEDSRRISRIRVHPTDPDRLWVAVMGHLFGPNHQRGVYRSSDGGETWEQVLYANESAGAVDLILDPTNPRIIYASTWRVRRTPYSLESGGHGSALWKSTDSGSTWDELSDNEGFAGVSEGGDPPLLGIIGIAVSPSNPENLYASVEADEGGIFRSRDGGETWSRVSDERKLRQRAWYYSRLYADPADEEVVYVLNVLFWRSQDGGKTYKSISVPHGDNHDLWIDPADPLRMIQSNDGGSNITFDGGATWSEQSGQPTSQMYRVSVDDDFPYRLLGGQQDNSAVRIRSRSFTGRGIGEDDWEPTAGGESGHIVAMPGDPDIVYGGSYGGTLTRTNHRTGERRSVDVWPDNPMGWGAAELKYRFNWNFPLFFSPHDPGRLYAAGNTLFVTLDEGATWTPLADDLTRNEKSMMGSSGGPITKDNTSVEYYGTILAACESPAQRGLLWCGSDDGLVHVSRDAGATWTQVTPDWPEWLMINCIDAHPTNPAIAYVAGTRYKLDDFEPYLYRTDDHGTTWTRIDEGIARDHFTRAVRIDPSVPGLVYAGTERGVYTSFDDGLSWHSLQLDLPIVPITDMAVKDGNLIVATQGRGFWILDHLEVVHAVATRELTDFELLDVRPAIRLVAGGSRGRGARGNNPASGAVFWYWLDEKLPLDVELELTIHDEAGNLVRSFKRELPKGTEAEPWPKTKGVDPHVLTAHKGLNRLEWDLRHPGAETFDGMVTWNSGTSGPRAVPGVYVASLRRTMSASERPGDDARRSHERSFEVLKDPRSSADSADLEEQLDFLISVRDELTSVHRELGRLKTVRSDVRRVSKRLSKSEHERAAELKEAGGELAKELTEIEEALYQTSSKSRQDPLNYPIRLNDKLAGVYGKASHGDNAPTESMQRVRSELSAAIQFQLERLVSLYENALAEWEDAVSELDLPVIEVPQVEPDIED